MEGSITIPAFDPKDQEPDIVIQRIFRHANVSTASTYYIKAATEDVKSAMAKVERSIPAAPDATTALMDSCRKLNENPAITSTAVN